MDENNSAVTGELEQTSQVSSPDTETSQDVQTSTESSVEESNETTVSNDAETQDEVVEDALSEVKSEKGKNRVQELANRLRDAKVQEQAKQQLEQNLTQSQEQIAQSLAQGQNIDLTQQALGAIGARMKLVEEGLRQDKEERLFAEAEKTFPQMDPRSKDYDRDFDDTVYYSYLAARDRGENITPADVAKRLEKISKKSASRAVAENEGIIAEKQSSSSGRATRTQVNSSSSSQAIEQAREKYRQSGRPEDLEYYLSLTK